MSRSEANRPIRLLAICSACGTRWFDGMPPVWGKNGETCQGRIEPVTDEADGWPVIDARPLSGSGPREALRPNEPSESGVSGSTEG